MEEITAGLKNLRLNYVPPSSLPYERVDESDEKFDNVNEVCAEDMIQHIDQWLEEFLENPKSIKLPRRSAHVFADSVNRFVYSAETRLVKMKIGCVAVALLKIIRELLLVKESGLCTPRKFYYLLRNDASFTERDKYEEIDIHGNTRVTDCSAMLRSYRLHLDHIHSIENAKSCPANFILIVEKLTVLETLIEEKFCLKHPCVLVTGCGQPDVQCRMFVKMLHDSLRIPICAMVDFNAYGIEIMKSFKVGSSYLAYESYKLTVPSLKFVGLSGQDIQECNIQISKLTNMSPTELRKAKRLKDEKWVKDTKGVSDSLSCNIEWEKRADIEILDIEKGFCFLVKEYLPKKVKEILEN